MSVQDDLIKQMVEDTGDLGGDLVSQNTALSNIVNPPAKTAATTATATPAKPDATQALIKQILASSNASKWTGEGFGSAEKNAADMAKILASIGITDITQFGKIPQYETQTQYQGQPVSVDEEGNPYIMVPGPGLDDYGNPMPARQNVDPSQVQQVQVKVGESFGNKATGQVVPNTYSERQTGNFWGGTFSGKGNTGYGVQFDAQGNPIFYTQGASSNDLAAIMKDLGPVFQIGMALATGGLSIPQQIAANMAVQVLSGQDVGDAIKNAAVSLAVANIPGTDFMKSANEYIGKLDLPTSVTNTLTTSFQNAAISGTKALLTGQDISDAVLRGAATGGINGAITEITNSVDGFKDLSKTQQRLVVNAVTGVISGKPLDQIVINSAIAAAMAEAKEQAKYKPLDEKALSELSADERKLYDEKGTKGLLDAAAAAKAAATNNTNNSTTSSDELVITGNRQYDDFLASIGITNPTQLSNSHLSNDDILRMINAKPDDTVTVTSKNTSCPVGTFYNPITNSCDPSWDETGTDTTTDKKTLTCPPGFEPNADGTACVPVTAKVDPPVCKPGFELDATGTKCIPVVTVTDKKCDTGYTYDETLKMCVPVDTKTLTCQPGFEPNADGTACVPVTSKPPVTPKPPIVTPPVVTPPITKPAVKTPTSITPSTTGTAIPTETINPIYAGEMGNFDLFATLPELLAETDDKKASDKSKDKTKMATGGHLDDLLAQQMTVDDLLNLLR